MAVTSPPLSAEAGALAAARARQPGRSLRDPDYRAGLRYLTFGRAVPTVLFAFMGFLQWQRFVGTLPVGDVAHLSSAVAPRALYLTFCALPAGIYLTRQRATATDGRLVARAAAFGGTLLLLMLGIFVPGGPQLFATPGWIVALSGPLLVAAWGLAVWGLLYLRRSLSIIPEARRLTTRGPYRLVRHPLYCGELTASVGVTLGNIRLVPLLALGALVGLQLTRTVFEERLLRGVFPEYAAYAARTKRIIPFVV